MANCAWLAPKPRKAPHTGLLVRAATASTSMAGTEYGPEACPAARSSTLAPTEAYGPESPSIRTLRALSRPSASHPAHVSMRMGWRLGCISNDWVRVRVHLTGRPVRCAASAVCAWLDRSSLPPKAPPLETSSTTTVAGSTPSTAAIWLRSSQTPCPPE